MLLIQILLDRALTQWHGFGVAADAAQVWGKGQLARMPLTTMNFIESTGSVQEHKKIDGPKN
ncbi:hypothetical protein CVT25_009716 [Psilocybe cyanescens]|uniref:Uncharacterized protein n=1 Tax=Psilocybe cyanescens TaxID=93625 RepID=A0A409WWL1_PSICY|nr:hypothetical protein CVT25_009716 [Psilocybe cyanescens]